MKVTVEFDLDNEIDAGRYWEWRNSKNNASALEEFSRYLRGKHKYETDDVKAGFFRDMHEKFYEIVEEHQADFH